MSALPFHPTVIWLTRRQLFARRRVAIAIAVLVIPSLIALLVRFNAAEGDLDAMGTLTTIYREIVLGVLLPLTALVFGTSAFGGEVDDGTLIYLMVKPVARWRLTFSKFVVAFLATVAVVVPSILLAWMAMQNGASFRVPLAFSLGAAVGSLIYCAIFVTLGITSRRALAIGLLYIVAFENVLSRSIIGVKSLSVREFSLAVSRHSLGSIVEWNDATVTMGTVYTTGLVFLVIALGLAFRKLQRYEVAERL